MLREEKHWPRNWSDGSWAGIKVQEPSSPSLGHPSPYLGWDLVVLSLFTKSFLLFVPWWKTTLARPLPEESPETRLCPRRGPHFHRWGKEKSHIHSSHQNKDMWLCHIIHSSWAGQLAKGDLQLLFKLLVYLLHWFLEWIWGQFYFWPTQYSWPFSEELRFLLKQESDKTSALRLTNSWSLGHKPTIS